LYIFKINRKLHLKNNFLCKEFLPNKNIKKQETVLNLADLDLNSSDIEGYNFIRVIKLINFIIKFIKIKGS